jgi:hypothetical protein
MWISALSFIGLYYNFFGFNFKPNEKATPISNGCYKTNRVNMTSYEHIICVN